MSTPKGVIAMIMIDGRVGAVATDFDQFSAYGTSEAKLRDAQSKRAMKAVGKKLIEEYGGPIIARLLDAEDTTNIAYDIYCGRVSGFTYHEERIGSDEPTEDVA